MYILFLFLFFCFLSLFLKERVLSESEAVDWLERYAATNLELEARASKLAQLASEIERNATLLGATGIDDRLQVILIVVHYYYYYFFKKKN